MLKESVLEIIGNTPLVRLKSVEKIFGLTFNLYGKVERLNPSGSVKDRAALFIIQDAIESGKIDQNTVIIEATSGNTGISLAMIGAKLGLKVVIVMPESASKERRLMMEAFGAEVILTSKEKGMAGCVEKVDELKKKYDKYFIANQFNNISNIKAHELGTSKEILNDLAGNIDVFIAGFGTSGTLIGCAKGFKNANKKVKIIGVEPTSSPLVSKGKSSSHKIQGIGANFIPGLFDKSLVDEVVTISDEDSYEGTRLLATKEGLLCGISSGASLMAALKLDKSIYEGKNVVIILPDNGERYLSVDSLYEK